MVDSAVGVGGGMLLNPLKPGVIIFKAKDDSDVKKEPDSEGDQAIKDEPPSSDEEEVSISDWKNSHSGLVDVRGFDGEEFVKEEKIFVKSEPCDNGGFEANTTVEPSPFNSGETMDVENIEPRPITGDLSGLHELGSPKKKVSFRKGFQSYHCDACGYKCVPLVHMEYHLRKHTGEKPLACTHCDYRASHPTTLIRHVRSQHTGERPYPCKLCNYKATQPGTLARHMRTHTGEKPYACSRCSFRTADLGSLNIHKSHHTGDRPFKCQLCVYVCSRKRDLRRHMIRKHPGSQMLPFHTIQPFKTSDSFRNSGSNEKPRARNSKGRPSFGESMTSSSESDEEVNFTIDVDSDTNVVISDWTMPEASSSGRRIKTPKRLDL